MPGYVPLNRAEATCMRCEVIEIKPKSSVTKVYFKKDGIHAMCLSLIIQTGYQCMQFFKRVLLTNIYY